MSSDMIPSMAPTPTDVNLFAIYALKGALLFMLLSLFPLYKLTDMLTAYAGKSTFGSDGFPSLLGIILHGVVFFLISYGLMMAGKRSKMTLSSTVGLLAGLVVIVVLVDMYKLRA